MLEYWVDKQLLTNNLTYGIILCGGAGMRLWPLSRKNFAKQFLKLYSEHSLIQKTFDRMSGVVAKLIASEQLRCNDLCIVMMEEEGEEKTDGKKIKIISLSQFLLDDK